jgi:hypothetical protein
MSCWQQYFERSVCVHGHYGIKLVTAKTVTGVVGNVNLGSGKYYIFVIHQAILIPKITVKLLGLMQSRDIGKKTKTHGFEPN